MTYSQLELPGGEVLYIAELPPSIAPNLSSYRSLTQELLDQVAPRGYNCQIVHHSTGAPYLVSSYGVVLEDYVISISHSGGYVALAIRHAPFAGQYRFGVDLQVASDKLSHIAMRFMSSSEQAYYQYLIASEEEQSALEWLYTVWGLKEAAYKAYPLSVKRCLATNFVVSSPDVITSPACYTIYADEGGGLPIPLYGYQLRSIIDSPYHLTYVTASQGC